MSKVIVIQFVSLDGVTEDPDGSEGTPGGGWAFRFPEAVSGDKFKLGPLLETGTLLLGRRTWQRFCQIFPSRTDDFSTKLTRMPKLVVTNSLKSVAEWNNSTLLCGDLIEEVARRGDRETLVVAGSDSIVQELRRRDLVDEYRLLIFPIVVGGGRRLFPDGATATMRALDVVTSGEALLVRFSIPKPATTPG
jgi:dihydrofolate reductase